MDVLREFAGVDDAALAVVAVSLVVLHREVFGRDRQHVDVTLVVSKHDRVFVRGGRARDGHETLGRVLDRLHGEDTLRETRRVR